MDADQIDAVLPQTQCTRCGYAACRPYAQALADATAAINRCPPGGAEGIAALARLLKRPILPLDPACGTDEDPGVAWIDAAQCIGCARCLPVCPVDAIIGAHRYLHTVIEEACTGCELCIESCPVDCIVMQPRSQHPAPDSASNRRRYDAHRNRNERQSQERAALLRQRKRAAPPPVR